MPMEALYCLWISLRCLSPDALGILPLLTVMCAGHPPSQWNSLFHSYSVLLQIRLMKGCLLSRSTFYFQAYILFLQFVLGPIIPPVYLCHLRHLHSPENHLTSCSFCLSSSSSYQAPAPGMNKLRAVWAVSVRPQPTPLVLGLW